MKGSKPGGPFTLPGDVFCGVCGRGRVCRFEVACSCWRGVPCDGSGKVKR